MDTFSAQLDASLTGDDGREFTTTPLGMDGPVLQGVLIDEVIEVAQIPPDLVVKLQAFDIVEVI